MRGVQQWASRHFHPRQRDDRSDAARVSLSEVVCTCTGCPGGVPHLDTSEIPLRTPTLATARRKRQRPWWQCWLWQLDSVAVATRYWTGSPGGRGTESASDPVCRSLALEPAATGCSPPAVTWSYVYRGSRWLRGSARRSSKSATPFQDPDNDFVDPWVQRPDSRTPLREWTGTDRASRNHSAAYRNLG